MLPFVELASGTVQEFALDRHQDEPRPELGNSEFACVEYLPIRAVSHRRQPVQDRPPVRLKLGRRQSTNIFEHHRRRASFGDEPENFRKQVPFVILAELFSGDRERWAWDAAREQVDATIGPTIDVPHVAFVHFPLGSVDAQRFTWLCFNLDRKLMSESSKLQAKGLPPAPAQISKQLRVFAMGYLRILSNVRSIRVSS